MFCQTTVDSPSQSFSLLLASDSPTSANFIHHDEDNWDGELFTALELKPLIEMQIAVQTK